MTNALCYIMNFLYIPQIIIIQTGLLISVSNYLDHFEQFALFFKSKFPLSDLLQCRAVIDHTLFTPSLLFYILCYGNHA